MEIDRKTLKALSADTRLDILKSLGNRRKMPSELAKEMNLATSTIVEHLNKLEKANLVRKEETGHKWIYYSLTDKGTSLVRPKVPAQFVIVLSLVVVVALLAIVYTSSLGFLYSQPQMMAASGEEADTLTRTPAPASEAKTFNVDDFVFSSEEEGCSEGGAEGHNLVLFVSDNTMRFAGFVITPDPCYTIESRPYVDGSEITIELNSVNGSGECIQCLGVSSFEGSFTVRDGDYNVRVLYNGELLKEQNITV